MSGILANLSNLAMAVQIFAKYVYLCPLSADVLGIALLGFDWAYKPAEISPIILSALP